MSIELMLNAVNINLMAFSSFVDGDLIRGQVFAVFVITVAAAEAACLLYTSPSPRDVEESRMPSSA